MVPLTSLWLPIVISAVFVFVASSILHMVLPLHKNDYRALPSEDRVLDALRQFNIPPGDYFSPRAASTADMRTPAFKEKIARGPVVLMTVMPSGPVAMGARMAQWFIYCVVVSVFAAYIAGEALAPGTPYLRVFQLAGCTAFTGYGLALWQSSIWYRRAWTTTLKLNIDALLFGLLTAGVFGWLWPRG